MNQTVEENQTENGVIEMNKMNLELGEMQVVMYEYENFSEEDCGKIVIGTQLEIDSISRDFTFYINGTNREVKITLENSELSTLVQNHSNLKEEIMNDAKILDMLSSSFEKAKNYLNSKEMQMYFEEVPFTPEGDSFKELTFNALSKLQNTFFDASVNKRWIFE
ncbi:hypothetical protein [Lysinibacillus boronitolerans]|uniref:hypothetical protein n=1 Tax=Lysinibacillus boronitolerans TaxID=309788 RepID=UPI003854DABA